MKIDDQIKAHLDRNDENWQRLIFNLRRHLDIWTHKHVKPHWDQMKLSYMPVLFNISPEGSTVTEIAQRSLVVKQTVSRTVKELEEKGMVNATENKKDKRSELLELTTKGKQLLVDALDENAHLRETYRELVGDKKFKIALEVLHKIVEYHESLRTDEDSLGD